MFPNIQIVGEANSGEKAIEIIEKVKPDVILMDVKMPGMGGLEATKHIVNEHPEIKILVVTVYGDEPYPTRVLQAGASGYMTKGVSVDEMIQAIKPLCWAALFVTRGCPTVGTKAFNP